MILLKFFFNNNYPVYKDYYPSYTSRFTSCTFHIIEPSEIAKFVIEIIDIRMFYKFNLTCFFLIFAASISAQTKIGGDPFVINDGSILELEDTERGVLFPRIVLDDVSQWTLLGSPVDGMVIVNEGGAAIDTVTLTLLSTSGDLSMTAAVSTANNQAIVFTFTGVHVSAHGLNFTIID